MNNPPMIGLEYSLPSEGNYLIVSKTLIEAAALLFLGSLPTGNVFGLDIYMSRFLKSKKNKEA
jgi:thiosulfate dehydrogenase [quinone] large subunit